METEMDSGMIGSGMEDIKFDVNGRRRSPEGKKGVDLKKVTYALT